MSKIYLESGTYIVELEDYDGSSITNMRVAEVSAPNTWYSFGSVALESPNPQWDGAYIGTHDHKFVGFGANEAPWAGNNFIIFTPTGLAADQSITTDSLLLSSDWGSLYHQTGFVATDVKSELAYNLKGHWSFDNGDATADVGNNGVNYGASFETLAGRTVATFAGDDHIEIDGPEYRYTSEDFTVSFWMYNNGAPSEDWAIMIGNLTGGGNGYGWSFGHYYSSATEFSFQSGNGINGTWSNSHGTRMTIPTGEWAHVTLVRTGSQVKGYLNGVDTGYTAPVYANIGYNSDTLYLGKNSFGTNGINANMDDVRIYEMALDASQVSDLYNATIVTPTPETTLVGHWSFDNGDATADVGTDGVATGVDFIPDSGRTVASFDASAGEKIDFGDVDEVDFGTGDFSVGAWVNFNSISTGAYVSPVVYKGLTSLASWNGYALYAYQGQMNFKVGGNGGPSTAAAAAITTGDWHHVVGTREGAVTKLYIDGSLVDTQTDTMTRNVSTHLPLTFGSINNGTEYNGLLDAMVDDVRHYEMALDASQVSDLYNATIVTPVADPTVSIDGDVSSMNLSDSVTATIELNGNSLDAPGNGYVFKWEHFDGGVWDLFQGADNAVPLSLAPSMSNKQIRAAIKVNEVYYYSDAATLPNLYPDVVIDNEAQYIQLGDTLSATVDIKGGTLEYYAWERQDSPGVWSVITGGEGSGIVNHDVTAADSGKEMQVSMRVNGEWFASANITIPDLSGDLVPVQKNGYYPLFLTEAEANLWSAGNGSSHTHEFGGVTYYMPNGLTLGVDQFHGTYGLALEHDMDDKSADAGSIDFTVLNVAESFVTDAGRSALELAPDGLIKLDSDLSLGSDGWTISMWFKNMRDYSSNTSGVAPIFMHWDGTMTSGAWNYLTTIAPSGQLSSFRSGPGYQSNGVVLDYNNYQGWHMITSVFDASSSEVTFYIDGAQVGSAVSWDGLNTLNLINSVENGGGYTYSRSFAEMISDLRVHTRSMDADEVAYWYAETTVVDPAGPQPVTLTSTDSYGDGWNGNVLTITNSDTGVEAASYTLADGYGETVQISLDNNANYSWSFGGGMYAYEAGVTVVDAGGNTLISISAGEPPSGVFSLGTPPVPPSVEFDQEATVGSVSIGDVLTATVDLQGGTLTYFAWEKYNPVAESWSSISGPTNQGVVDLTVDASMSEAIVQVSMEVDGSWYFTDTVQLPELSEAPSVTRTIRVKFGGGALAASVVIKDGNGDYVKAFIPIQISWGGANYYTADTLDVYNNYNSLVTHPQQMVNIGGGDPLYPAETPQGGGTFEFDVDMPDGNYSVQMYCGAEPDPPYIVAPTTVTIYDANSSFEDPIATLQGDGSGFDTAYYDFTIGTVSPAYDWTHGGQLTNIVKFSRGTDSNGNPSFAYAKKEDDNTTTLFLTADITDFSQFSSNATGATGIVGAPVSMEYGPNKLFVGTDIGKAYEIGLDGNTIISVLELHSMAGGESIREAKYDSIQNQWIFEAGEKIFTVVPGTTTAVERYVLPSGAKCMDIAAGDSGVAIIIKKADHSLSPIIATAGWTEISDETAMVASLNSLGVADFNYDYVMDKWIAASADGQILQADDLLQFLGGSGSPPPLGG